MGHPLLQYDSENLVNVGVVERVWQCSYIGPQNPPAIVAVDASRPRAFAHSQSTLLCFRTGGKC